MTVVNKPVVILKAIYKREKAFSAFSFCLKNLQFVLPYQHV